MRQHGILGLLALALVSLATPAASAADVPGDAGTRAALRLGPAGLRGTFDGPRDSDWYRVTLEGGVHYGFHGEGPDGLSFRNFWRVALRDRAGRVLADNAGERYGGFGHRPTRSGTYLLEVTDEDPGRYPYPYTYTVSFQVECSNDVRTTCPIAPGQTRRPALNWGSDEDTFRVTLKAGKRYTAVAGGPVADRINLFLRDARGGYLLPQGKSRVSFTVGKSGTYFIHTSGVHDRPAPYSLALTTP